MQPRLALNSQSCFSHRNAEITGMDHQIQLFYSFFSSFYKNYELFFNLFFYLSICQQLTLNFSIIMIGNNITKMHNVLGPLNNDWLIPGHFFFFSFNLSASGSRLNPSYLGG
jgi:hypothetical protein